ncbi:hypothetical protein F5Y10DRAFT_250942 [Nemania abortiva]|nr:hypothetical protein F5Y10DRAFT_250942 [Nemania abortiva]
MSEITRLGRQYLNEGALDRLLQMLFGTKYTVERSGDVIEITAERKLDEVKYHTR